MPRRLRKIHTVGVAMDLGQSRRGVDMGPYALRYAGLRRRLIALGHEVEDRGNIAIPERDTLPAGGGLDYLPEVAQICGDIYDTARDILARDAVPLFLGGDHSIAVGTVGGVTHDRRCGLLWIDAHGDFNTPETSPSGNLHGMPLAALLGRGAPELVDLGRPGPKLAPEDVVLVGIRDLDPQEKEALLASGVSIYTMHDIDERGLARVAEEALVRLSHLPAVHVSLDMDSVDPSEAPGVGTPVPGGLSYREAHLLMEIISETMEIGSVDVVEVNPILDIQNSTAKLALELVSSLFGKTIL